MINIDGVTKRSNADFRKVNCEMLKFSFLLLARGAIRSINVAVRANPPDHEILNYQLVHEVHFELRICCKLGSVEPRCSDVSDSRPMGVYVKGNYWNLFTLHKALLLKTLGAFL